MRTRKRLYFSFKILKFKFSVGLSLFCLIEKVMVNMQSSKVSAQLHDCSSDVFRSPANAPAHCPKAIRDFIPFPYFNRINVGIILQICRHQLPTKNYIWAT